MIPLKEIKFFTGSNPFIRYDTRKHEDNQIKSNPLTSYDIGVSYAYGLKWFFKDNMSLTAE